MGFWKSVAGVCSVELTSASPSDMLTAINQIGVTLFDIEYVSDLCFKAQVYRHDIKTLQAFLARRGDKLKLLSKQGVYWDFTNFLKRPVLVAGILIFIVLVLYLPTRVLFVQVEGNEDIPSHLIIEKAEMCGIGFGASRREVRSERMKNALLSAIPELQWAGVNTAGCVAVISVQERSSANENSTMLPVGNVVATRDGIIQKIDVLRGTALCKVGQAVKAGQVLVSGYTDCGITVKAERAEAEITALTFRNLEAVTLSDCTKRGAIVKKEVKYSLRIGKNIINFSKDSGISDATCVKMYEEKFLTLPGGFELPVALLTEHLIYLDNEAVCATDNGSFDWLADSAQLYLRQHMLAGSIQQADVTTEFYEGAFLLHGRYSCVEMIGQVRSEEILQGNGKRN